MTFEIKLSCLYNLEHFGLDSYGFVKKIIWLKEQYIYFCIIISCPLLPFLNSNNY